MKSIFKKGLLFATLAGTAISISGCGSETSDAGKVYVYNWGHYIDEDVNDLFEEETGIEVVYEVYPTNEDMFARVEPGTSAYDIVVPSDYMVERMINEGLLQPIDTSKLENYAGINEEFKNLPYDESNAYSVPYLWGSMGIIYNTTMVEEPVDEWADMWNPAYKNNIFVYDSEREGMMVALKKLGYSMNTTDEAQLEEAKQELIAQAPNVLAYVGDEGKGKMQNGEAAMMVAWAGDAMLMTEENSDLAYVVPKEGTNFFVDALAIPANAKNVENAHKYIDFLCRPDIAAMNAEYVGYSTPIEAARQLLPEEIKNNPIAYPATEEIEKMEMFEDLGDTMAIYSRIWTEVKASSN